MIQYIKLPQVPTDIVRQLPKTPDAFTNVVKQQNGDYYWSDSFNQEVNDWCREHVCDNMWWAFQMMTADLKVHKDVGTKTKFIYLINPGGNSVYTDFYAEDRTTVIASYVIEPLRWHILQADVYHSVRGIEPGQVRFSITGRLFANLS